MSAECDTCGTDLDYDFKCIRCAYEAMKAERDVWKISALQVEKERDEAAVKVTELLLSRLKVSNENLALTADLRRIAEFNTVLISEKDEKDELQKQSAQREVDYVQLSAELREIKKDALELVEALKHYSNSMGSGGTARRAVYEWTEKHGG